MPDMDDSTSVYQYVDPVSHAAATDRTRAAVTTSSGCEGSTLACREAPPRPSLTAPDLQRHGFPAACGWLS